MRSLRFSVFLLSLLGVGVVFAFLSFLPRDLRWRSNARVLHAWGRALLRFFGIKLSEFPDQGSEASSARVIVSNHLSYLDIPVLLARGPCLFLGKAEIASWPLLGWVARWSGMIFVDRTSLWSRARSILEMQERLRAGVSVVVFPEGTTSLEGPRRGQSSFFAGAFRVARMECVALEALCLEYDEPERCAWIGDADFVSHLWAFLERSNCRVKIRSHVLSGVEDRIEQRETTGFVRAWMLDPIQFRKTCWSHSPQLLSRYSLDEAKSG